MYSQCAAHVSVGASVLSSEWAGFCAECLSLSLLGSLTNACVLCCQRICWQRDLTYELYSVLISTLHSDHYIRFLWWRLIALSLWGGWRFTNGGAPHTYSTHTNFTLKTTHASAYVRSHKNPAHVCKNMLYCTGALWNAMSRCNDVKYTRI